MTGERDRRWRTGDDGDKSKDWRGGGSFGRVDAEFNQSECVRVAPNAPRTNGMMEKRVIRADNVRALPRRAAARPPFVEHMAVVVVVCWKIVFFFFRISSGALRS